MIADARARRYREMMEHCREEMARTIEIRDQCAREMQAMKDEVKNIDRAETSCDNDLAAVDKKIQDLQEERRKLAEQKENYQIMSCLARRKLEDCRRDAEESFRQPSAAEEAFSSSGASVRLHG